MGCVFKCVKLNTRHMKKHTETWSRNKINLQKLTLQKQKYINYLTKINQIAIKKMINELRKNGA